MARAFLLPAVVAAFGVGAGDLPRVFTYAIAFLAIPALLRAVIKYRTFRYRLAGDELVYDVGLLHRHRRVIPLRRVQNIDTRQSALQRLFGVSEVRVETASGDTADATLAVLSRATALRVREELLRRRRAASGVGAGVGEEEPAPDRLAHLSPGQLAIVGATSNRAGLIAAGLFALLQFLPQPLWLEPDVNADMVPAVSTVVLLVLGLLLLLLLVGWVVSIISVTIGYHDFTLERTPGEIQKRYGLLSRRQATVLLRRVQAVRVEESILRRPFGLTALRVESAGAELGARQQGRVEAFLPLAGLADVPRLVGEVFAGFDYGALDVRPVHPRSRRRAFIRYSVPVVAASVGLAVWLETAWLGLLLLLPLCFGAAHLHYRHLGYSLAPGYVMARAGFLNRVSWVVPLHKVQTLHVTETPFQRRHGLATLIVDTAAGGGGGARITDLAREDALTMQERLLHASLEAARARKKGATTPEPCFSAVVPDPALEAP